MKSRLLRLVIIILGLAIAFLKPLLSELLLNSALIAIKNDQITPQTISLLQDAGTWSGRSSDANWYIGYIFLLADKDSEAINTWRSSPDAVNRLAWRGKAASRSREYEQALQWYEYALVIEPETAYVWDLKGDTYMLLSEHHNAIECYNYAITYEPHSSEYLIDYASALIVTRADLDLAESYLQQAVEMGPPTQDLYRTLASLAQSQGNIEGTIYWLKQAAESKDHSVQTLLDLASLYNQLGNPAAALPYVEQAFREAPHSDSAKQVLEETKILLQPTK